MATPTPPLTAGRLRQLILQRHPDNFMAYADLFAMGCLLHAQGHTRAGRKLIDQVAGAVREPGNQAYLRALSEGLAGNELAYASDIHAHHEVNELLDPERCRRAGQANAGAAPDRHALARRP